MYNAYWCHVKSMGLAGAKCSAGGGFKCPAARSPKDLKAVYKHEWKSAWELDRVTLLTGKMMTSSFASGLKASQPAALPSIEASMPDFQSQDHRDFTVV